MRNICLALVTFVLSAGLMYGCAEKKQPAEKAQEGENRAVESAVEKPVEVKQAPDVSGETKVAEKKDTAPAAVTEVKEKPASIQAPVLPAPVKEVLKAPVAAVKEALNEPAASVKAIEAGAAIFKAKCSLCHGAEGKGSTMAPSFNGNAWIKGASSADVADVIKNGRKGAAKKYSNYFSDMPASKGMAESDVSALVEYLRSIN